MRNVPPMIQIRKDRARDANLRWTVIIDSPLCAVSPRLVVECVIVIGIDTKSVPVATKVAHAQLCLVPEVEDEIFVVVGEQLGGLTIHNETLAEASMHEGGALDLDVCTAIISQLHEVRPTKRCVNTFNNARLNINECLVVIKEVLELAICKGKVDDRDGVLLPIKPRLIKIEAV